MTDTEVIAHLRQNGAMTLDQLSKETGVGIVRLQHLKKIGLVCQPRKRFWAAAGPEDSARTARAAGALILERLLGLRSLGYLVSDEEIARYAPRKGEQPHEAQTA